MTGRILIGFILSIIFLTEPAVGETEKIIGGREVFWSDFPEVALLKNPARGQCTATVVGPEVVLTAGHCARDGETVSIQFRGGKQLAATCTDSPLIAQGKDHDLSLCKLERRVELETFPLLTGGVFKTSLVSTLGFGCTNRDRTGGNDGKLRMATVRIVAEPDESIGKFDLVGRSSVAAICPGDSGGPVIKFSRSPRGERHEIVGVNSKVILSGGRIADDSFFTSTFTAASLDFFGDFARENSVEICGVTSGCLR